MSGCVRRATMRVRRSGSGLSALLRQHAHRSAVDPDNTGSQQGKVVKEEGYIQCVELSRVWTREKNAG